MGAVDRIEAIAAIEQSGKYFDDLRQWEPAGDLSGQHAHKWVGQGVEQRMKLTNVYF